MTNDDLLDSLTRAAAVSDDLLAHLDFGAAPGLAQDGSVSSATDAARARRRRRLLLGGAGLALAAVAAAGPAAADYLSAHTGLFGHGQEDGTGELITMDAPDTRAVMAKHLGTHPLPPGETWDEYLDNVPAARRDLMASESTLDQWAAYYAHCRWERAWLHHIPGAQAVLDEMPTWPEFQNGPQGPGSMPDLLSEIATETRTGTATLIRQDYRVNCQ